MASTTSEPMPDAPDATDAPAASSASHTIPKPTYKLISQHAEDAGVDMDKLPKKLKEMKKDDEVSAHGSDFDADMDLSASYCFRKDAKALEVVAIWKEDQDHREEREHLRETDPVAWYLSSETMISQGLMTMVVDTYNQWYTEHSANSAVNAQVVVVAVKKGFAERLATADGAGWKYWADQLKLCKAPTFKPGKSSSEENCRKNISRKKEYFLAAFDAMPIISKAYQARENLSKSLEVARTQIQEITNDYALRMWNNSFPNNTRTSYVAVSDDWVFKTKTAAPQQQQKQIVSAPAAGSQPSDAMSLSKQLLDVIKSESDNETRVNRYTRQLRYSLKRFMNDPGHRDRGDEFLPIFYGRGDIMLIENDGARGERYDMTIEELVRDPEEPNLDGERWEESDFGVPSPPESIKGEEEDEEEGDAEGENTAD